MKLLILFSVFLFSLPSSFAEEKKKSLNPEGLTELVVRGNESISVTITHRDGSIHTFLIPLEMESSFDLIRSMRTKREEPNPQIPNTPGKVISEEKNTGELIEGLMLETFERAIQSPQFQPPSIRTKVEAATAEIVKEMEKTKGEVKASMKASLKTKDAETK